MGLKTSYTSWWVICLVFAVLTFLAIFLWPRSNRDTVDHLPESKKSIDHQWLEQIRHHGFRESDIEEISEDEILATVREVLHFDRSTEDARSGALLLARTIKTPKNIRKLAEILSSGFSRETSANVKGRILLALYVSINVDEKSFYRVLRMAKKDKDPIVQELADRLERFHGGDKSALDKYNRRRLRRRR